MQRVSWLALLPWLLGMSVAWAQRPAPDPNAGQAAYERYCARCHGDQGRGDGVDAKRFYPRPRDLSMGVYKFRSTASGTPPTDEDLFEAITTGLPGSHMPDWTHLDDATRWQLVEYLKSLSPLFAQTPPEPVKVAADPGAAQADLAKGNALYQQLGCASCHGAQGRANGLSAAGLVDDWGMPIRPADLTKGWSYRGGASPRAIMLRVLTGIDGAGMPSYAGALSPEDAWHVAYYVASLQQPAHWNLIVRGARLSGELPTAADDPRWSQAERADVRLRHVTDRAGEWADPPTVSAVTFQVAYNETTVALHATWNDPTQDAASGQPFDRLAIVLRPATVPGDVVSLQVWPYVGAPALDACVWSADAPQPVELLASDLDGMTQPSPAAARLAGRATYDDGRWHLVIQRPRRPAALADGAVLEERVVHPIAFMVWDGGNPGARAVSPWVDVVLRTGPISAKSERPVRSQ